MARALDLTGWVPARLRWTPGAEVEWVYTGARRFDDPFFEETLTLALRDPFALLFRRRAPLDALRDWAEASPGLQPAGFVFHMSRCGSTLVTQMLARSQQLRVLSEPNTIDAAIRAPLPRDGRIELLRALVSALGQPLAGETRLVIKLDSWSVVDLDLVADAFPETPWIFLFRRPDAVLSSQLRHAGVHASPGALDPALFGLTIAEAVQMPREEYIARVLARICEAALEHAGSPNGLFVDYEQLPGFVLERLPSHFGLELSDEERKLMVAAAELNAKNPVLPFELVAPDLSPEEAAQCARLLEPLYRRLAAC
jgi:hypothetical protein